MDEGKVTTNTDNDIGSTKNLQTIKEMDVISQSQLDKNGNDTFIQSLTDMSFFCQKLSSEEDTF